MPLQSESIRIKGHKITLIHSPESGRWSTNYGSSDTREGAIRKAAAGIEADNDREDTRAREQAARAREHESRTVECPYCRVRVANMATHSKTAKHRNAVAYSEYSRRSRY